MPFKSKSQQRAFFAMEDDGELKKGTAKKWAKETKSIKSLPEKVAAVFVNPNRDYKASKPSVQNVVKDERSSVTGGSEIQHRNDIAAKTRGIINRNKMTPRA